MIKVHAIQIKVKLICWSAANLDSIFGIVYVGRFLFYLYIFNTHTQKPYKDTNLCINFLFSPQFSSMLQLRPVEEDESAAESLELNRAVADDDHFLLAELLSQC